MPIWVYLLFFVLLWMGIKSCNKRVVKLHSLFIVPALFAWLSTKNAIDISKVTSSQIPFFTMGILSGLYFGYLHGRNAFVRADKKQHLVELSGDWTILILMMAIFAVQFVINYILKIDPALKEKYVTMAIIFTISGITTAMVIGRNLTYFYRFHKAHSIHLKLAKFKLFK